MTKLIKIILRALIFFIPIPEQSSRLIFIHFLVYSRDKFFPLDFACDKTFLQR